MLVYILPILLLLLFSQYRLSRNITHIVIIALMLFLCFGYMTGSDWRAYETDYYSGFTRRLVEPGYMLASETFLLLGVNFWVFHIILKCFAFISIMFLILKIHDGKNCFYSLALWYASYGLYMFINCPFRNVIACGIGAIACYELMKNNKLMYYLLSALAMTFHLSAVVLLCLPFSNFHKIGSKFLVCLYIIILAILGVGGTEFIINILSSYLPTILASRIDFYSDSAGSVFSIGLIPRLICLYLLLRNRNNIIKNNRYGAFIFSNGYLFLIISLVYYVVPMLFRSALFLGPFYVIAITFGLKEYRSRVKILLKFGVSVIFVAIVCTTVRSVYYVPYTNIIPNVIVDKLHDYSYRSSYNPINSPYRNNIIK